jgi:hypothetical protein
VLSDQARFAADAPALPTSAPWAVLMLAATVVALAALAALHVLPTGLSPLRNAVSHYGITRFRLGYRVLTVSMGVAGLAAAVAVGATMPPGFRRGAVIVLLAAFGVARLVISWFPMDVPGVERSRTGAIHGLLAVLTFVSAGLAAAELGRLLRHADGAGTLAVTGFADIVVVIGWVLVVAIVATMVTVRAPDLRRWFGVAERGIYVGMFALLISIGVELL